MKVRSSAERAWQRVLRLDSGFQIPGSLLNSYRERYGAAFSPR